MNDKNAFLVHDRMLQYKRLKHFDKLFKPVNLGKRAYEKRANDLMYHLVHLAIKFMDTGKNGAKQRSPEAEYLCC